MAIQTGIFKTPTGGVYNPAQQIEQGFDKTAGIVTDFLGRKAQDFDQQQAAFGQMYSNLGELEAKLQENYAGINQQMIDSTREWLKESMKSGKRATDPEFQMGLSQRVGRIRAGMANADRNRELLKQAGDMIQSDATIVNKSDALANLYLKMNDPDFLISKNEFRLNDYIDQYISPQLAAKRTVSLLTPVGTRSERILNDRGDLIERTFNLNEAVASDAPLITNPDGTVSLNIQPNEDLIKRLLSGAIDPAATKIIERNAKGPDGIATQESLYKSAVDYIRTGMGPGYSDKVIKTADEIKKENEAFEMQKQGFLTQQRVAEATIAEKEARAADLAKSEKEMVDLNQRYAAFNTAFSTGSKEMFGDYAKGSIVSVDWLSPKTENRELKGQLSSLDNWKGLTRDQRAEILSSLGIDYGYTPYYTDTKEFYDKAVSGYNTMNTNPKGIVITSKIGGNVVDKIIPFETEEDIKQAFITLEQVRKSGSPTALGLSNQGGATTTTSTAGTSR